MLALSMGLAMLACAPEEELQQPDVPVNPENPENPDPENPVDPDKPDDTVYYTEVTAPMEDWSGNYLITAKDDGAVVVLAAWDLTGNRLLVSI